MTQARWFYIIPPLFFFWIIAQMDKLGISVIITNHQFLATMGLIGKPAAIGLLVTGFAVVYGVANFLWGFVIDRIGPRRAAIAASIIWGLTIFASAMANSYGTFMVSRMILGVGEGVLWPVSNKFIANWFPNQERGRAQAGWLAGDYLGPALGIPLIVAVMLAGGWREAFWVLGILSLVIPLPLFIFLARDLPSQHRAVNAAELEHIRRGQPSTAVQPTASLGEVVADWRYWAVWFAYAVDALIFFGLSTWLPTYLESVRHFSPQVMGAWTSGSWVLALVAVFVAGYLADRVKIPAMVEAAGFVVGVVAILLAAYTHTATVAAAGLAVGLAMVGATAEVSQVLILRYGKGAVGRAAGLMGMANGIGGFAPAIMGAIAGGAAGFTGALLFLTGCAAAGAAACLVLSPADARTTLQLRQDAGVQPAGMSRAK
jgi:ACS family glucarate transporter-like MFS transporter